MNKECEPMEQASPWNKAVSILAWYSFALLTTGPLVVYVLLGVKALY